MFSRSSNSARFWRRVARSGSGMSCSTCNGSWRTQRCISCLRRASCCCCCCALSDEPAPAHAPAEAAFCSACGVVGAVTVGVAVGVGVLPAAAAPELVARTPTPSLLSAGADAEGKEDEVLVDCCEMRKASRRRMASCGRRSGERCFAGEPGFAGDLIGERMNDVSDDCFIFSFIACDAM